MVLSALYVSVGGVELGVNVDGCVSKITAQVGAISKQMRNQQLDDLKSHLINIYGWVKKRYSLYFCDLSEIRTSI